MIRKMNSAYREIFLFDSHGQLWVKCNGDHPEAKAGFGQAPIVREASLEEAGLPPLCEGFASPYAVAKRLDLVVTPDNENLAPQLRVDRSRLLGATRSETGVMQYSWPV